MSLIFRDSTRPGRIPLEGTDGVMAYANGLYEWPQEQIDRFINTGRHLYRIDVTGAAPRKASILDVERGDATPQMADEWVDERNAFRNDACCYVNRSGLDGLLEQIAGRRCWLWIADWTGSPHQLSIPLPPEIKICAIQYATIPNTYDTSVICDTGWLGKLRP